MADFFPVFFPDHTKNQTATHVGGKGAALAKMVQMGVNVPHGFTIPTTVCKAFYLKQINLAAYCQSDVRICFNVLDQGGLFSIRSGAPVSMPGMMDTILNLGITIPSRFDQVKVKYGDHFAYDCLRRFYQMWGEVVQGVRSEQFSQRLELVRRAEKCTDSELPTKALRWLCMQFSDLCNHGSHGPIPVTLEGLLYEAVKAVILSWNSDRAKVYRSKHGLPDDMGTAVTVQRMVFGNGPGLSGSGVVFTRCPKTGENLLVGEWLQNAQGEDVVAGVRTPENICTLPDDLLMALRTQVLELEAEANDMQDVEFTIEDGELYVLQTRNGKRSPAAAKKIAKDMGKDEPKTSIQTLLAGMVDAPDTNEEPKLSGMGASGGAVVAEVTYKREKSAGRIYIAKETTPEDYEAMCVAAGILTQTGGITCHAAVVAREINVACVVGASDLKFKPRTFKEGEVITIDGASGRVWDSVQPVKKSDVSIDLTGKTVARFRKSETFGASYVAPVTDFLVGTRLDREAILADPNLDSLTGWGDLEFLIPKADVTWLWEQGLSCSGAPKTVYGALNGGAD